MTDHQNVYRSEAETYQLLISREDFQGNLPAAIQKSVGINNRDLLDLGAGTGRISCEFADEVQSLIALDLSPGMLAVARQRLLRSELKFWMTAAADHRYLPLPENSVDLVISAWSFSYLKVWAEGDWIPEIEQGMREVRRVLRDGGDFLLIETLGTGNTEPIRLDFLTNILISWKQQDLIRAGSGLITNSHPGRKQKPWRVSFLGMRLSKNYLMVIFQCFRNAQVCGGNKIPDIKNFFSSERDAGIIREVCFSKWRFVSMSNNRNPWKILDKKVILEREHYLRVEDHVVQHKTGKIFENWPWVETPDVICVLAQTAEGEFLTFREIKYALQEESRSIVGGMVEEGESALQAARRELLEETGYASDRWDHLGTYLLDANRGVGRVDLFQARDVRVVSEPDSDDLEEQELVLMTREQLLKAVLQEEFQILPWAAAIALSLLKDMVE